MNEDTDTQGLFKQYGGPTINDAIEQLAVACMGAGVDNPTKIVFPKGSLQRINDAMQAQFKKGGAGGSVGSAKSDLKCHNFPSGVIELVEE